jgi:hypothetical protein
MSEDQHSAERHAKLDGYCAMLIEELGKLCYQAEIRKVVECQCPRVFIEGRVMAAVTYEEELVDARLIVRPAWEMDERPKSFPVPPDLPKAAATIVRWRDKLLRMEQEAQTHREARKSSM